MSRRMKTDIDGLWFAMRIAEAEVATVYAPTYDTALNASLRDDGAAAT